jgi:hypothetical protein
MIKHFGKMAIVAVVMVLLVGYTWGLSATAQGKPSSGIVETTSAEEINLQKLKAKRAETEASTALPDSVKKSSLTFLDQAIGFKELTELIKKDAESFAQTIQKAPKRTKEIENELKRPTPPLESEEVLKEVQALDTENLENKIRQEEAVLIEAKANLAKLIDQIAREENAPQKLRESINNAKAGLKEVQIKIDAAPPPNEPPPMLESRRTSLLTEQAKYQAEITANEQRLAGQSVFLSLLRAKRNLVELQVGKQEGFIKVWKEIALKRLHREAEQAVVGAEVAKSEA